MRSGTGRGTLGEVRDGFVDPPGGQGRVRGLSGWSGTGQGTLPEIRDGLGTFRVDKDGSRGPRGGPKPVGEYPKGPGRVGGPSGKFGNGRGTLG